MTQKTSQIKYSPGIQPETGKKGYILEEDYKYHSERYDQFVDLKKGMWSDGATGFVDLGSQGKLSKTFAWFRNRIHGMLGNVKSGWFFVHDELCNTGTWSDGTPVSNWVASTVAKDILRDDMWKILSFPVWGATFLFGGGKARENGMKKVKNGSAK